MKKYTEDAFTTLEYMEEDGIFIGNIAEDIKTYSINISEDINNVITMLSDGDIEKAILELDNIKERLL